MLINKSPLHPAQKDVYLDQLINVSNPYYNIGGYTRIIGPLIKTTFIAAVNSVPEVFDAYRMRFDIDEHTPQIYFDDSYQQLEIKELDYSMHQDGEELLQVWMKEQFSKPFEIKKDNVLFEHYLVKLKDEEHLYFFRYHHLISDGFGLSSQNRYIAKKYSVLINNEDADFSYLSYKDEAVKADAYYHSDEYAEEGKYWKDKIEKKPQQLLQRRFLDSGQEQRRCETVLVNLSPEDVTLLEDLQKKTKSSIQQLTIAALMIYFGKTSDKQDFIFGTPLHKRKNKKVRDIVGMFTGILPFKGVYQPDLSVDELIKHITTSQREDYRYSNYQIGDLSRYFKINAAEEYLLEIVINYAIIDFSLDFGEGMQAGFYELPSGYGRYPIEIWWKDYGKQQPLQLSIDYQLQFFSAEEMELVAQRLLFILKQFSTQLDSKSSEIEIIPPSELLLLERFNDVSVAYPDNKNLVEIFNEHVIATPAAIALQLEDQQYSYEELNIKGKSTGT
ncbi:condensation domain-containing protein [Pedobacter sp. NJ-S-72]